MKNYFLDEEYNVYDDNSNLVGKVGVNGLVIDGNNNLVYNGNIVGLIGGNLADLDQSNNKDRGNVRTLRKNNNAGFGQMMIVTLVLLCLTLFVAVFAISMFS